MSGLTEIGTGVPDSADVSRNWLRNTSPESRTPVRNTARVEITGGTHVWILGQSDAEQAEAIRRALST